MSVRAAPSRSATACGSDRAIAGVAQDGAWRGFGRGERAGRLGRRLGRKKRTQANGAAFLANGAASGRIDRASRVLIS